jgi:hypothetical protein
MNRSPCRHRGNAERALLVLVVIHACGGGDDEPMETDQPMEADAPMQPDASGSSCDVRELFATDGLTMVGCSGALCHSPGVSSPDLVSAGLEERLLDQPSNPDGPCAGELLVDADEPSNSLLFKKVGGMSTCGAPMPLTNPSGLSADQVLCIEELVELVAAGGAL